MHIRCCFLEVTKAVRCEGVTALVKASTLLCFALVVGSAALTQQPAQWRPSIAEDNKAATLDDTLKFVVGTANDRSVDRAAYQTKNDGYGGPTVRETVGASSPTKCTIEWSDLYIFDRYWANINRWKFVADLSKVDALSVAVTPSMDDGSIHGFIVGMSGTSGSQIADVTKYSRFVHKGILGRQADIVEAESAPASCAAGFEKKKCSITQGREAHSELFLADQEAAHRVARALMHAALLCGGVKAVSPF
ncbi:MAG: hypothetical protein ABSG70_05265 [Terriglobales bacterium]